MGGHCAAPNAGPWAVSSAGWLSRVTESSLQMPSFSSFLEHIELGSPRGQIFESQVDLLGEGSDAVQSCVSQISATSFRP